MHNKDNLRPLDGLKVVSLEHAIAAPFCTRQLADLGASVIKIERPESGDFARGYDQRVHGLSSHFVWTNRSKKSLTLDLKAEKAKPVMEALLKEADILVQNLAPGAATRLGLSFEQLHEQFPKLIVCDISGYGEGGSYEKKKAYDLLIQSESGFLSTTGFPGEEGMVKAGCSIADIAAGMYAYSNILSALILRERTGKGSRIELSMLESLVEWMGYPMYYAYEGAEPPPRAGASHSTIYPYGPFTTGDHRAVMLGLQNEREWAAFCEVVLDMPELVQDERFNTNYKRSENRQQVKTLILDVFHQLTSEEVIERLDKAGIANAHVNDMHAVWQHPQLQQRERWTQIGSPVGELRALLPPGRNSAYTPQMAPVPALGENTEEILAEIGYDTAEILQFKQAGIV